MCAMSFGLKTAEEDICADARVKIESSPKSSAQPQEKNGYWQIPMRVPKKLANDAALKELQSNFAKTVELALDCNCKSILFKGFESIKIGNMHRIIDIAEKAVKDVREKNPESSMDVYFFVSSENFKKEHARLSESSELMDAPQEIPNTNTIPEGIGYKESKANPEIVSSSHEPVSAKTQEKGSIWVQGGKWKHNFSSKDGRYIIGKPSGSFRQTPFLAKQPDRNNHRSDVNADIACIRDLRVFAASLRGASHYYSSTTRQDSFAIGTTKNDKWLIASIADGVSSATHAHILADYLARQAVLLIDEEIGDLADAALCAIDWTSFSNNIVTMSQEYCRKLAHIKVKEGIDADSLHPRQLCTRWASTLEFIIVCTDISNDRPFAFISIAGDGAAYVLSTEHGWRTIKAGKKRIGDIASNEVVALPNNPGVPMVKYGVLNPGENLFLTTDGLSDMIGDGTTELGGFLQDNLSKCSNLVSFMRIMDVSMFQADDDRTGILIKTSRDVDRIDDKEQRSCINLNSPESKALKK